MSKNDEAAHPNQATTARMLPSDVTTIELACSHIESSAALCLAGRLQTADRWISSDISLVT